MDSNESIESLMARYVAGDLSAFDALYEQTAPRVFAFLLSMSERGRAEDLCQITFLKFHNARAAWIPGAPVMPWLFAIARNALRDQSRKDSRARVRLTPLGALPEVVDPGAQNPMGSEDGHALELKQALGVALGALPPLQREAFVLTREGGLSHRDAARVLGATETAIKLRVHRAYESLRRMLGDYGRSE